MSFLERIAQRAAGAPPAAPARPADGGLLSGPQALRAAAPEVEEDETEVQRAAAVPDPEEPEARRAVRRTSNEALEDEDVQRAAADAEEDEVQRAPAATAEEEEDEVQRMANLRPERDVASPTRRAASTPVRRAEAPDQEEEEVRRAVAVEEEEETVQREAAEENEEETLQRAAAAPVVEMPPEEDPPRAARRAPLAEAGPQRATPMPRLSSSLAGGQDVAPTHAPAQSDAPVAVGQSGPPTYEDSRAGSQRVPGDAQDTRASFGVGDASALVPNANLESLLAAAERDRAAEAPKPAAAGTSPTRPQVTIERLDVFVTEPPREPNRASGRASGAAPGPRLDTRYLRGL